LVLDPSVGHHMAITKHPRIHARRSMLGRMVHGMAPSTRPFWWARNERGDENRAIGDVPESRFALDDESSANEVCPILLLVDTEIPTGQADP